MAGYADYQAVAEILAAIGTPAQGTGSDSISSLLTKLDSVITNLESIISELEATITQIQTGTPSIKNPVNLVNLSSQSLAAGAYIAVFEGTATGESFSLSLDVASGAGSTKPFCTVFLHTIQANGQHATLEYYDLPMGSASGDTIYLITGPLNANTLLVGLTNRDTVGMTWSAQAESTNITVDHTRISAKSFGSVPGYTIDATTDQSYDILLAEYYTAIAAGATASVLIPPYTGTIAITVTSLTPANAFEVGVSALYNGNGFIGTSGAAIYKARTDSNGYLNVTVPLPKCACIVSAQNKGTTASDVGMAITVQQY